MLRPSAVQGLRSKVMSFDWRHCSLDDGDGIEAAAPAPAASKRCKRARSWMQPDIGDDVRGAAPVVPRARSWMLLDTGDDGRRDVLDAVVPVAAGGRSWCKLELGSDIDGDGGAPVAKRSAALSSDAVEFLKNSKFKEHLTLYDRNGVDADRIARVTKGGCCKCVGNCGTMFSKAEVMRLCEVFHKLPNQDRQFMLHTMYTHSDPNSTHSGPRSVSEVPGLRSAQSGLRSAQAGPRRTSWFLMGRPVCVKGFAALLGIGQTTLYREVHMCLDRRRSIEDEGRIVVLDAPQTLVCNSFFRDVYASAAEPLPQGKPLRVGDAVDDDDDFDWQPEIDPMALVARTQGREGGLGVVMREIPHNTVGDLYWQFLATCELAGTPNPPCRKTFQNTWNSRWSSVMKCRHLSQHMQCQTCYELKEKTYRTHASLEEKMAWARRWRDHLRDQYEDRTIYWGLRFASRQSDSTVLVLIIDSMDKKKCAWPRYSFAKRPHEIDGLKPRPRMTLTCAIAHGWLTGFYVAPETLSHGSNAFMEVLCIVLSKVRDMCRVQGRRFPLHLVLQADNTVAQTKNGYCAALCTHLVGASKFATVTMNFMMVGHTHEDVDQMFGLVTESVVRKHRWETPIEFERLLMEEIGPKVRDQNHAFVVQGLRSIRNFNAWLEPQRVTLRNCWATRDGIEAPHSFTFKRRSDLTGSERAAMRATRAAARAGFANANGEPGDVFCVVKTYMRDKHLQQPPVLVLPTVRMNRVQGHSPTTVEPVAVVPARAVQLNAMASMYEKDSYRLFAAAAALRTMALSVAGPPLEAGWLAEPPLPNAPVQQTLNEYFDHLPQISWHMLATFHQV